VRNYRLAREKFLDCLRKEKYLDALQWGYLADPNDAEIACYMACLFFEGHGTAKNLQKAFEYAKKSSDGNFPLGHYILAGCFSLRNDREMAFAYFRKSAECGLSVGQTATALCFHNGYGCRKNYEQAYYWFSKAVQSRPPNPAAEYYLGLYYLKGYGVNRNISAAKGWLRRAAGHGSQDAQKALSELR